MSEAVNEKREPSTGMSFAVFGISIAIILLGVVVLGFDIHIILLVALAFACLVSATLGYQFDDLVECMKKPLGQAMSAMIIFIFIGIIIASWIFSGTVPALIYYGLHYITPKFFLPVGLLLCSLTSMSTNLAPASAGTTLYKHIGAMWKTTLPAYLTTFGCFTVLGFFYQGGQVDHATIDLFIDTIGANFRITPLLLLPMVVLLVLNMRKFPAIPGMAIGSLLAVILAVAVQGFPVGQVVAGLNYGYVTPTGVDLVDQLLLRGGIQNMMYTFSLSCIAISFGGVMEHVGYLKKIVAVVISRVKYDFLMVPVVILSTTLGTLTMGEVYLSIVVNGSLYRQAFQERKLRPEMLSRLLEEGGTLTQVFIPWSTSGVFIAATLGVSTAEYWKFAFLNYINPLLSIVLCLFGYGVLRVGQAGWRDQRGGTHHTSTEESEKC